MEREERVLIILLTTWSRSFKEGMILSVPKFKTKFKDYIELSNSSAVSYQGRKGKEYEVIDFIADADNVTENEFNLIRMIYPFAEKIKK